MLSATRRLPDVRCNGRAASPRAVAESPLAHRCLRGLFRAGGPARSRTPIGEWNHSATRSRPNETAPGVIERDCTSRADPLRQRDCAGSAGAGFGLHRRRRPSRVEDVGGQVGAVRPHDGAGIGVHARRVEGSSSSGESPAIRRATQVVRRTTGPTDGAICTLLSESAPLAALCDICVRKATGGRPATSRGSGRAGCRGSGQITHRLHTSWTVPPHGGAGGRNSYRALKKGMARRSLV